MTQPKDFSPIRPSVWGLTTTWPRLQRLCEEDPQARGLLDVVVTLRIIPHGGDVPNELIADSDSSPICKSIDE